MLQKIFLEAQDLKALREGKELMLVIGGMQVPLALTNGHRPAAPSSDDGPPAKRLGHRAHTEEFKRKVVAETAAPGKTVAGVAAKYDLHRSLVDSWRRRLKAPKRIAAPPTLSDERRAKLLAESDEYVKQDRPFEPTLTQKYGVALKTIYGIRFKRSKKK